MNAERVVFNFQFPISNIGFQFKFSVPICVADSELVSVKVCDQSSVYCGVFVVAIDNFSFGCRFVFASNRACRFGFDVFPDWLSSTKLTIDVGFRLRIDILVDMESSRG